MRTLNSITAAIHRTTLALGCVVALGACTSWRETPAPAPTAPHEFTGPVHVIRHGTFSLVLRDAHVKGDTLYGYSANTRMAVALSDVQAIRQQGQSALQMVGTVALGAAAAFGAYVLWAFYGMARSRS